MRCGIVFITTFGNFPFRKSKIIEVIAERVKKKATSTVLLYMKCTIDLVCLSL